MELEECRACGRFGVEKSHGLFVCKSCGTESQKFVDEDFIECHPLGKDESGRRRFVIARERNVERKKQEQKLKEIDAKLKGVVPEDDDEEEYERTFVRLLAEDPEGQEAMEKSRHTLANKYRSVKKVRVSRPRGSEPYDPSELLDRLITHIWEYYIEGLEKMLQLQCQALVETPGVNPVVCGIAGSIWSQILASRSAKITIPDELKEADQEGDKDLPVKLSKSKSKRKAAIKSVKERLPLHSTLTIVFLACHVAREPLLPSDIIDWALNGSLPYIAAFLKIGPAKEFLGPDCDTIRIPEIEPKALFRPACLVNSKVVETLAGYFANHLGLELPPVNFPAISTRFVNEIGLEAESHMSYLMRLYQWYMPDGIYLSGRGHGFPTRGYVMAMVIVMLKLLYCIDGNAESSLYWPSIAKMLRPASSNSSGRAKFQRTLDIIEQRLLEKAQEDGFDLKKYLKYCQDVVFAGVEVDPNVDSMCKHLWSLFEEGQRKDQAARPDQASSSTDPSRIEAAKSKIHNRIAHELETGGFKLVPGSCIEPPAPSGSCSYVVFPMQRHRSKYKISVSGDYFILLFACAQAARIRCDALHKCVQEIESDILKLEAAALAFAEAT